MMIQQWVNHIEKLLTDASTKVRHSAPQSLHKELHEKLSEIASLETQIESLTQEFKTFEEAESKFGEEILSCSTALTSAQEQLASKKAEVEAEQKKLQRLQQEQKQKDSAFQTQLSSLEAEIKQLGSESDTLKTSLEALKLELKTIEQSCLQMQALCKTKQQAFSAAVKAKEGKQQRAATTATIPSQEEKDLAPSEYAEYEQAHKEKIAQLENQSKKDLKIKQAQDKLSELDGALKKKNQEKQKITDASQNEINQSTALCSQLRGEIKQAEEQEISALQAKLEKKQTSLEQKRKSKEQTQSTLERLNAELEKVQKEVLPIQSLLAKQNMLDTFGTHTFFTCFRLPESLDGQTVKLALTALKETLFNQIVYTVWEDLSVKLKGSLVEDCVGTKASFFDKLENGLAACFYNIYKYYLIDDQDILNPSRFAQLKSFATDLTSNGTVCCSIIKRLIDSQCLTELHSLHGKQLTQAQDELKQLGAEIDKNLSGRMYWTAFRNYITLIQKINSHVGAKKYWQENHDQFTILLENMSALIIGQVCSALMIHSILEGYEKKAPKQRRVVEKTRVGTDEKKEVPSSPHAASLSSAKQTYFSSRCELLLPFLKRALETLSSQRSSQSLDFKPKIVVASDEKSSQIPTLMVAQEFSLYIDHLYNQHLADGTPESEIAFHKARWKIAKQSSSWSMNTLRDIQAHINDIHNGHKSSDLQQINRAILGIENCLSACWRKIESFMRKHSPLIVEQSSSEYKDEQALLSKHRTVLFSFAQESMGEEEIAAGRFAQLKSRPFLVSLMRDRMGPFVTACLEYKCDYHPKAAGAQADALVSPSGSCLLM